mgnify:CR=1 FL=1
MLYIESLVYAVVSLGYRKVSQRRCSVTPMYYIVILMYRVSLLGNVESTKSIVMSLGQFRVFLVCCKV